MADSTVLDIIVDAGFIFGPEIIEADCISHGASRAVLLMQIFEEAGDA